MARFQSVAPKGERLVDLRPDLARMAVRNLTKPEVDPGMLSISSNMRALWRCGCGEEFEAFVHAATKLERFICRLCRYGVDDPRLLEEFVRNLSASPVCRCRAASVPARICVSGSAGNAEPSGSRPSITGPAGAGTARTVPSSAAPPRGWLHSRSVVNGIGSKNSGCWRPTSKGRAPPMSRMIIWREKSRLAAGSSPSGIIVIDWMTSVLGSLNAYLAGHGSELTGACSNWPMRGPTWPSSGTQPTMTALLVMSPLDPATGQFGMVVQWIRGTPGRARCDGGLNPR